LLRYAFLHRLQALGKPSMVCPFAAHGSPCAPSFSTGAIEGASCPLIAARNPLRAPNGLIPPKTPVLGAARRDGKEP
jgi:hypothetical protein